MQRINSPICAVFWNYEGRLILALPFSQEGGRFCLQLAPDLFADFRFDPAYAGGNLADGAEIISTACGFAGLTGISERAAYPVLCPANAPVQRAAVERAHLSASPSVLGKAFRKSEAARTRLGEFLRQVMAEVAINSMGEACPVCTDIPLTKRGMAGLFVNDGESVELSVRVNSRLEVDPDGEASISLKLWNSYT